MYHFIAMFFTTNKAQDTTNYEAKVCLTTFPLRNIYLKSYTETNFQKIKLTISL